MSFRLGGNLYTSHSTFLSCLSVPATCPHFSFSLLSLIFLPTPHPFQPLCLQHSTIQYEQKTRMFQSSQSCFCFSVSCYHANCCLFQSTHCRNFSLAFIPCSQFCIYGLYPSLTSLRCNLLLLSAMSLSCFPSKMRNSPLKGRSLYLTIWCCMLHSV